MMIPDNSTEMASIKSTAHFAMGVACGAMANTPYFPWLSMILIIIGLFHVGLGTYFAFKARNTY